MKERKYVEKMGGAGGGEKMQATQGGVWIESATVMGCHKM